MMVTGRVRKNMQYNPGNYEKYMTKNPLKRKMVERLNKKIVGYV